VTSTLDPATLAALAALGLAPFLFAITTSFAKFMIVGGLLRQAIGTQQAPPNTVLAGLALILTLHVMAPVGAAISAGLSPYRELSAEARAEKYPEMVKAVVGPLGDFLRRNASAEDRAMFAALREESGRPAEAAGAYDEAYALLTVDAPAFLITELSEAFQIAFLLFVPFLIVDLVVTNVLLALGATSLSPNVVTLPLKVLLFVLVDGWKLVLYGLTRGYA
jgi:type III secretion protein R